MGGGTLAYRLSKVSLNALTVILADEVRGTGVLINAMCPGWVRTEMGGRKARLRSSLGGLGELGDWACNLRAIR